jgi:molybdenum cofactor biosynthesis protein B
MTLMSVEDHRARAAGQVPVFVLTVSDTRTTATDTSGHAIASLLAAAGHTVTGRAIVADDPVAVRNAVTGAIATGTARAIITTGGTGISRRDTTYEALAGLLEKRLDGFGEIFRALSFQEIGAAAMLSRAVAGTIGPCIVFVLPGSEAAVRLAMERLIVPELAHVVQQLDK